MKKRAGLCVGLILLGVTLLIPSGKGRDLAPAQKWVARYNGPGNGDDNAQAMAMDKSGNVYVTGVSTGVSQDCDYATIKYSPAGKRLWVQRYDGPAGQHDFARAIAVDGSGNVYVTGQGYSYNVDLITTIKYNTTGKQLWVQLYNYKNSDFNEGRAIAVDGSGNVYVAGHARTLDANGVPDYACVTIKYNTNGNKLWVKRYDGPGNHYDTLNAITVDGSGNVYVTGESWGSGTYTDFVTIKYNTNGKQLWLHKYNGPDNGDDFARAMAVDKFGNVYVTGETNNPGVYPDFVTIKYKANGQLLWVQIYDGPSNGADQAWAIALDKSGNAYVAGNSLGSGTYADYVTIKYNTNGEQLWAQRYNGPGNYHDVATAVAVDKSGNVYVSGESFGSGSGYDCATIKYNTNGNRLWVKRYNGPGNEYKTDRPEAIAVDNSGNVYVTGQSYGSGIDCDYITIKY